MQIWSYRDLPASASYIPRLEVCVCLHERLILVCLCGICTSVSTCRSQEVSGVLFCHFTCYSFGEGSLPELGIGYFFSCAVFLLKELTPFFTQPPPSLPHLLPHFWGYMCKAPNSDLFLLSKHCTPSHTLNWPVTRSPAPKQEQLMTV